MTAVVLRGDAAALPLRDESVDLIVTSPPYWSLRSYSDGGEHYAGQIGDEDDPGAYLDALIDCTREWMRVLKPGGSLWLNMGDKYNSAASGQNGTGSTGMTGGRHDKMGGRGQATTAVPVKSLMLLPQRYAIRCVDQLGLILRAEIIWAKPNGLPESVTDRVRRSHEQVFHFVKSARYYSAVDEVREAQATAAHHLRYAAADHVRRFNADRRDEGAVPRAVNPLGKLPGSVWEIPTAPLQVPDHLGVDHFAAFPPELVKRIVAGWSPRQVCSACGEGRRPVAETTITGKSAVPNLAQAIVRGVVNTGGAPAATWGVRAKDIDRHVTGYACACTPTIDHPGQGGSNRRADNPYGQPGREQGAYSNKAGEYVRVGPSREYLLDGWTPPPTTPGLVLDPFGGTGTTALVASCLGRVGITVDMSWDYARLARWRTSDPGERARVLGVPKPPPQVEGQLGLFEGLGA